MCGEEKCEELLCNWKGWEIKTNTLFKRNHQTVLQENANFKELFCSFFCHSVDDTAILKINLDEC